MKKFYNINRRKFLELFGCTCCGFLTSSCATVPITDRRQLKIYPESTINAQAAKAYEKLKNSKKIKLITKGKDLNNVVDIGEKISKSVSIFFKNQNLEDPTSNFDWEYILIDNKKVKNAWCMPGGKIAVYTGILDVTKNINGLAAVMGHEIAHAVAKHSVERMSAAMAVNVTTQIADIFTGGKISQTRNTVGRATGMDVLQLGIMNPFGRKQESEADYLGLIFSSLSGYNIKEAVNLWERMKEANKGKEPPQFMSTHPSSDNRIISLNKWIPKVILEYPPLKN
jgi:Putative Zn-dependent protease, contains TPR repeats